MRNKGAKQKSTSKRGGPDHAFGCDLTEHLQATGHDVPQVLRTCAEFIEEHGIVDGIYRLSGVTSNIQRLRQEFVMDSCPDLTKEIYLQDIHCVGSLCKLYFRELPNPLLTYQLYKKFTDTMSVKGEREQLQHIQSVVKELPDAHLRTLEYLSRHLSYLATLSHQTNMHARNLALVWAPNLLRSKDMEHGASSCSGDSAFLEVRVQQSVVEFILKHTDQIFSPSSEEWSPSREATVPTVAEKYATLPSPSFATSCGALKLMSLEEAQARSLGANHPARQRENSLPDTRTAATLYHTVIDLNDSKRKLSSKPSKRWKSIFGLGRSAKLSRNGSVLVRAQDSEKVAIRPSKSMDSICSLSTDDNMPSSGNSVGSGSGGGACNGLPIKSRTLGSEADFSLSDENLKVWGFSPKSPKKSVSSTGTSLSNAAPSATGPASATSQKALPEQLKVFKGDESSGPFRPTSPKNRRMLFSSSSHHASGGGTVVGSAPHLSFFPLESPSLSPRHQRKALNISEPFAVSVPLRVSAVISANSTPCRPGGATAPALNPTQSLSKAAKAPCSTEPAYTGGHKTPDISSNSSPFPSEEATRGLKPQPNTSKMATSCAAAQDTAVDSCPIGAIQEERAEQHGRVTGCQPMECLLPGLEDILSDMAATPAQNLSPGHVTPKYTSKIPSEGVTPELSGTPNEKLNALKDPEPSIPGASSPGSSALAPCTPGPSTPAPSSPGASTSGPSTHDPCTPAPCAPGPSSSAPCTTGPSTPAPSTAGSSTPGPSTPAPSTGGSSTPGPSIPAPSTAGSSTPGPSTPAPSTAGSSTPGPSTPAPCTSGPSTPVPSSPGPFTPGTSPPAVGPGAAYSQIPTPKADVASETHPNHPPAIETKHTPLPQPHQSQHPAPPSQADDITKGKECITESSVLLPNSGSSESAQLVDVRDSDSLQNLHGHGNTNQMAAKAGVQSQTLEGSMLTVWPEDELRIMENIPEEALAPVQAPCPSAESLDTASTYTEKSAQIPSGEVTHQGPILAAFDPALSHLSALRETDILSDLEDALTSTTNQTGLHASTKQPQKETVSEGSAMPQQTSHEASEKTIDSSAGRNDVTTQQIVPAVDNALGGVSTQAPGKMPLDDTSQEVTEERKAGVRRAGPNRVGKERRKKGREREKGLDQVEPWDDLLHTQWVTSPLHTPTIEELFTDSANQNKMRVCRATVSQIHPDTGENSQEKFLEPSPKTTGISHRSQAVASRRNSSPIITSGQLEGRAENSLNPPLQWAPKLPASTAPVARRFHRQASHDSCLSPLAPLQPCLLEQRGGIPRSSSSSHAPSRRHRPCSLDLDRDLDLVFDLHGNLSSCHRVIRDISNQPITQQNILDLSTMKSRGNLPEHRDHGSAPWRSSKGCSADFSEELELFLGNPRAPARRNSAPPPVGVASVRAPLTIRTIQAKAVPVIPPKVQYSSMPASASADLKKLPEDPKKLPEDRKKSPEDQKKVDGKKVQEDCKRSPEDWRDSKTIEEKPSGGITIATPDISPSPFSRAKEERENCEPVPRVTPLPMATATMPGSSPSADPLVLRRKNSPCAEPSYPDQMHPPPPASALLRQRPSFRNRPRPQSLVLFSPPFPIMDPPSAPTAASSGSQCPFPDRPDRPERPHTRASAGLGRAASFWDKPSHRQEETRSRRDRPGGQASSQDVSSKEHMENFKGSESGVVLRGSSAGCGKMTLPKSGQRLETSPGSCFYQPQRRSMVLDNRSSRQIE